MRASNPLLLQQQQQQKDEDAVDEALTQAPMQRTRVGRMSFVSPPTVGQTKKIITYFGYNPIEIAL